MRMRIALAAVLIFTSVNKSDAQDKYPTRPIRMIYGFPAGTDIGARHIAEKLADRLGKPVVFENVAGAAGNIAADQVANAPQDGYTIGMLTGANIVLRPLIYRTVP